MKIKLLLTTYLFLIAISAAAAKAPDIVIFITDDQSQSDVSIYGNDAIQTPNLERLANDGMTFSHAFVASPSCAPSRAALLTGLMPARNGAEANHTQPRAEIKKLPAYFQELGYEVVAFGKVTHGDTASYGFDQWATEGWLRPGGIDDAVVYLQHHRSEEPLLMLVGIDEPHVPWPDIDGYDPAELKVPDVLQIDTTATRSALARYYTAISEADRKLGVVYDLARQKLDNPLFVFTSDHGSQWPFGKWNLYDYGIRVPLVAAWPGVIEPGSQTEAMISWVDLLPTLLEVAGGSAPKALDGRSFAPVLAHKENRHRDRIFTTHSGDSGAKINAYPIRSLRDRNWKYILNLYPELPHQTHIDRAPKGSGEYWPSWLEAAENDDEAARVIARYGKRPGEELYDLRNDPLEQHNLVDNPAHAQRLATMRADLEAWMEGQGDQRKLYEDLEGPWFLQILIWLFF